MKTRSIGILVLVVGVLGVLGWYYLFGPGSSGKQGGLLGPLETKTFAGTIGSEKSGFLDDEVVLKELGKQGARVSYTKAGSIEQVQPSYLETSKSDFLWPSSQIAVELFKELNPTQSFKSEVIFNTPIVLFSWDKVADALQKNGIVTNENGVNYVTDFAKLIKLATEDTKWSAIGLGQLYGKVSITSTDPAYSNSGQLFAGLMANALLGELVTEESLPKVEPAVKSFFAKLGFMERSTGNLFEQFLNKGMGTYPIIVGYENQLIEFALQSPELWQKMKSRLRILYPKPTVWSSHILIGLSSDSKLLIDALRSKEVQKLAWERHGFRASLEGMANSAKVFEIGGIPEDIDQVMPLPSARVMQALVNAAPSP